VSAVEGERTAWTRNLATPLRAFLRAETAGAVVLGAAAVAAVVWANVDLHDYDRVWSTTLSVRLGSHGLDLSVREWVNAGLMTFFFFVVGLEARRELDVGELRNRRRLLLPVLVGASGMLVPIAVYLAVAGGHGWGAAMSTDTALSLGVLAVLGRRVPNRLRAYLITVLVVDDLLSLLVLVFGYSSHLAATPLVVAVLLYATVVVLARTGVQVGILYLLLGIATWAALHESGVDPVVTGIAFGLLTWATPAGRGQLERASDLFRLFREQPTPELARVAQIGVAQALSPNERLQALYLPWTSYLVVPLFALANAGVQLRANAFGSRIALAIIAAYLVGKPVGIALSTLLVGRAVPKLRPPVGWLSVTAGGAAAGTPFTISLLVAALALHGGELESAKLGVLAAAVLAPALSWLVVRVAALLPLDARLRALLGTAQSLVDLAVPFDPSRDHVRGPANASVTLVEYGDFECPFCGRAERSITELLGEAADVRYVWRHLPLTDVHPHAQLAAEAAEAAAAQGKFWEMHDVLLAHQDALEPDDLLRHARRIGLDVERFADDVRKRAGSSRIADDVDSAEQSGVAGTPTFFVNGRRHWGAYDLTGLMRSVKEARARARAAASGAERAPRRSAAAAQP
jgi:Na+/H+ antiporter NhaA/predicted DsbA family dithiol-disulfide isomerase